MRVTIKGQVTIPKSVRDRLGIVPGSEVEFVHSRDGVRLVAVNGEMSAQERIKRFEETLDRLEGTIDLSGTTTDQYMEWLRGPREDLDAR